MFRFLVTSSKSFHGLRQYNVNAIQRDSNFYGSKTEAEPDIIWGKTQYEDKYIFRIESRKEEYQSLPHFTNVKNFTYWFNMNIQFTIIIRIDQFYKIVLFLRYCRKANICLRDEAP